MPLLRTLLLGLAVLVAYLLLRWSESAPGTSAGFLEEARSLHHADPPDYGAALRRAEQGIEFSRRDIDDEHLAALRRERLLILRSRWEADRSREEAVHEATDLEQVLDGCREWLSDFDGRDRQLLLLGARSAMDLARADEALEFLVLLDPEEARRDGDASALRLEARVEQLGVELRDLRQLLAHRLTDEQARTTFEGAQRAAARPPEDAQRSTFEKRMRAELDADLRTEVWRRVDRLGEAYALASGAAVERLSVVDLAPEGRAIACLQTRLVDAGEYQAALDLGRLALDRPDLQNASAVQHGMIRAEFAAGRVTRAARRFRDVLADEEHPFDYGALWDEDLLSWCRIAHGQERWSSMADAAAELQRRAADTGRADRLDGLPSFFFGLARAEQGNLAASSSALGRVAGDAELAHRGLRLELEAALARAAEASGDPRERMKALKRACGAAPRRFGDTWLERRLARVAGEAWWALGLMQLDDGEATDAEQALTHALRLLPERRGEIEPQWAAAGGAHMRRQGHDLEQARTQPAQPMDDETFGELGPFEACERARHALGAGIPLDVELLLLPLLDDYPDLPVALELLAQHELARGRLERALSNLLALAEVEEAAARPMLLALPAETFDGPSLRRWARVAPRPALFGRLRDRALAAGDLDQLAALLSTSQPRDHAAAERAEAAAAAARLGLQAAALRWLESLPQGSPLLSEQAGVLLWASLVTSTGEDDDALSGAIERLRHVAPLSPRRGGPLLRCVDQLLAQGALGAARRILALSVDGELQGPWLVRRATLAWLEGDPEEARARLDQAEPLLDNDLVPRGRLLLDLRGQPHGAAQRSLVARGARELLALTPRGRPMQAVLLTLLDPRDAFAAEQRLADIPPGAALPVWSDLVAQVVLEQRARGKEAEAPVTLTGFEDGPNRAWAGIEPGPLAALILAAESAPFAPLALTWLGELEPDRGRSPGAALLRSRAWSQLQRYDEADAALAPWCLPGDHATVWFERERLALLRLEQALPDERAPLEAALWDVRRARIEAIGQRGTTPAALTQLDLEGRSVEDAWAHLAALPEEWLVDPVLRRMVARGASRASQWDAAVGHHTALVAADPSATPADLPELLVALHSARQRGLVAPEEMELSLGELVQAFPHDPLLLRAWLETRLTLAPDPEQRAVAETETLAQLARFRGRHGGQTIESMRPGEGEHWATLYQRLDPVLAEAFAREEVDKDPGHLAPWLTWCRSLRRSGHGQEALAYADALARVISVPELEDLRALLRLELNAGTEARAAFLARAPRPEDTMLHMQHLLARLESASVDEVQRAEALREALGLWEQRAQLDLRPVSVACRLVRAVLRAPTPDVPLALRLLEDSLAATGSSLDRLPLEATRGLLNQPASSP